LIDLIAKAVVFFYDDDLLCFARRCAVLVVAAARRVGELDELVCRRACVRDSSELCWTSTQCRLLCLVSVRGSATWCLCTYACNSWRQSCNNDM